MYRFGKLIYYSFSNLSGCNCVLVLAIVISIVEATF